MSKSALKTELCMLTAKQNRMRIALGYAGNTVERVKELHAGLDAIAADIAAVERELAQEAVK